MGHFPVSWLSGELSDGYEEKNRVVSCCSHSFTQERWERANQQNSCIADTLG